MSTDNVRPTMFRDNVVDLDMVTRLDRPPERILNKAIEADLSDVFVAGWDQNGGLYLASSKADGADLLWLIELAKRRLFELANGER